jgi:hypothetical protein
MCATSPALAAGLIDHLRRVKCSYVKSLTFDASQSIVPSSSLVRGRRPEAFLKVGARLAFPRRRTQRRLGRCGNRHSGTTTRLRGARCTMPRRKCQGTEPRTRIRKSPGGAPRGARPDRKGRGRLASARHVASKSAFTRVHSASISALTRVFDALRTRVRAYRRRNGVPGVSRKHPAPLGAPPPLIGAAEKATKPGRSNAPRERRNVSYAV